MRSLEGTPVAGGRIKKHRVWRSDNLMFSPAKQIEELKQQGLTTAIDLRAPDEVQLNSTRVLATQDIFHLRRPMTRKAADPTTLATTFKSITTPIGVGDWYLRLARARASTLLACLQDIIHAEGGVVFYCAAGKDRTGVLAASLLLFLGAEDETIIADFAKTGPSMPKVYERQEYSTGQPALHRQFPDHPILRAAPESMARFLERVHESGGIEAVLLAGSLYQSGRTDTLEGSDVRTHYTARRIADIRKRLRESLVR